MNRKEVVAEIENGSRVHITDADLIIVSGSEACWHGGAVTAVIGGGTGYVLQGITRGSPAFVPLDMDIARDTSAVPVNGLLAALLPGLTTVGGSQNQRSLD